MNYDNVTSANVAAMEFVTSRLLPEELPTTGQRLRRERIVGELVLLMDDCDDLGLDFEAMVEQARAEYGAAR